MKTLKTFLLLAVLFVSLGASAQVFNSQSFIVPSSVTTSNLVGLTNILTVGGSGTNVDGTVWTNGTTRIVATNTANSKYFNVFRDAQLFPTREGAWPQPQWVTGVTNVLQTVQPTPHELFIRLVGGSGANAAVTFIFVPVCDGTNEVTVAGEAFAVAITATTTTPVTLHTNFPSYKWQGCKGVRLRSVTNADTDASSQVTILSCSLNGFVP